VPLWFYRDSKGHQFETLHSLGVLFPFTNHHTQMTCRTPLWTQCAQTISCSHQLSYLLEQHTPLLGPCPLPCAFPYVDHRGCVYGVIQSLWCIHVSKGRHVHYLGMLPSCPALPNLNPSLHRPSQGKKGLFLLGFTRHHRSPRCSYPRP
jgi:hypothetical protein